MFTAKPLVLTAGAETHPPTPVLASHDEKFDATIFTSLCPESAPPFVEASHKAKVEERTVTG